MALFPHIFGVACILGIISALPPQKEIQLKDVLESMYRKRHDNAPTQPGFMDEMSGLFLTAVKNFRNSLEQILGAPLPSNATHGGNGTETASSLYHNSQQQRVSNGVNHIIKGALEGNVAEILHGSVDIPENEQFRNIANRVVNAVFATGNGTS